MKKSRTVAIIPARGGSKRIPKKNIKNFLGKPMLEWTITKLIRSNLFDDIIVSTDDHEIAEIAKNAGGSIPFMRSNELSDDQTPTAPVIADALTKIAVNGKNRYEYCCCVYPCNPLLDLENLKNSFALLVDRKVPFVYPVCEYPHPIQRGMRMNVDLNMQFISPEHELTRTQDLEPIFHDAGQFYWGEVNAWISGLRMHTAGIGMKIPHWQVADIDSLDDWRRAELIYQALHT